MYYNRTTTSQSFKQKTESKQLLEQLPASALLQINNKTNQVFIRASCTFQKTEAPSG